MLELRTEEETMNEAMHREGTSLMNPPKNPDDEGLVAAGEPAAPMQESVWSRNWPWLLLVGSACAAGDLIYVAAVFPREVQPGALTLAAGAVLVGNALIAARSAGRGR